MAQAMAPIGAALLGTGIFAKDVYKSNFKAKAGEVELKAVWSRTMETAQAFVEEHFPQSRAVAGEAALQDILDDPSIALVVVVLPVQAALQVVRRCLAAGKAVVQEKPVAASVHEAAAAIREYRAAVAAAPRPAAAPLWLFAENYRYEAAFLAACRLVPRLGRPIKLDLIADLPMDARNRYYGSSWRRDTAGCPGGFFSDSCVHFAAALRLLAGAAGLGEPASAAAHALQVKPDLSFPDSLVGWALFPGGVPAAISISLAAHQVRWSLSVVGTEGSLEVSRGGWGGSRAGYTLSIKTATPIAPEPQIPSTTDLPATTTSPAAASPQPSSDPTLQQVSYAFSGCPDEFAEFLRTTCQLRSEQSAAAGGGGGGAGDPQAGGAAGGAEEGKGGSNSSGGGSGGAQVPGPGDRSSPEEGARDLALIEALLASAAAGGQPVPVVQI